MSSADWKKVSEIFHAAMNHDAENRIAFLKDACGNDESLREEVESLIAANDHAGNFIVSPILPDVMRLLSEKELLSPGQQVGAYRIIEQIGYGGMGAVYKAERADEQFEKYVAIKVIKRGMDRTSMLRRFQNERQILAGFDHPNIARLLDAGTLEGGVPYFVMEHVEGQPIDEYCDVKKLSIRERLELFSQVCDAVSYAHRHLVIHRDIKPSNIFVTADGEPKLLDFGIAKILTSNTTEINQLTVTGFQMMTPDYASPEQVRGETITTATDIYSLGVLLYEILTGHLPHKVTTQSPVEIVRLICEVEPEKPSLKISRNEPTVDSSGKQEMMTPEAISIMRTSTPERLQRIIQGDIDHIVMMALRKEPSSRYPSVEAFAEDIHRHLNGIPVVARKSTMRYLAGKFVRRHRMAVASASIFVAILIAFGIAMTIQSGKLARQRDQAEKERDKSEKVSKFLVDLFHSSNPIESKGNTITAREILDSGSEKIKSELKDQPVVRAALMDTIGQVYMNLAMYDKAAPLLEAAFKLRKENLEPGHQDLILSLNHLGELAYERNRPEAETLYRQALDMGRRSLGNSHIEVAHSLTGLAKVLAVLGKHKEAAGLYREALIIQRKLLGNDAVEVAENLYGLGVITSTDESESMYREALHIFRNHQHPGEATCLALLAQFEIKKGKYEEAEGMAERSVMIRKKIFGNEHEKVAIGLSSLGNILYEEEKYDRAKDVFNQGLIVREKVWGKDNPEVAYDMFNLAKALKAKSENVEAESLFRRSLEMQQKLLPPDHPEIARCQVGLGSFLQDTGRPEEAEPLLIAGLALWKKLEANPPYIVEAENALALTEATLGRPGDQERVLINSYQKLHELEGERTSRTKDARQRVYRYYEMQHQPEKAEKYRVMERRLQPA